MASCPKCGKTGIKRRKGVKRCPRCGPFDRPKFEVWMGGYLITGGSSDASYCGSWAGDTFEDACEAYSNSTDHPGHYSKEKNTYWGCTFHDNETDARKTYG